MQRRFDLLVSRKLIWIQRSGRTLGGEYAGLAVEATAPAGLVEAVSAKVGDAQVLAVQWHPEWRTDGNPDSQGFFRLFGRVLRGERVQQDERTPA